MLLSHERYRRLGGGGVVKYGKSGTWPSVGDNDGSSTVSGTNHTVTVTNPPSGWFYLWVENDPDHTGVTLTATQQ